MNKQKFSSAQRRALAELEQKACDSRQQWVKQHPPGTLLVRDKKFPTWKLSASRDPRLNQDICILVGWDHSGELSLNDPQKFNAMILSSMLGLITVSWQEMMVYYIT